MATTKRSSDHVTPRELAAGEPRSREQLIVAMWAEGLSYAAIGRELGIGERSAAGLISRLRANGWDLPPRR